MQHSGTPVLNFSVIEDFLPEDIWKQLVRNALLAIHTRKSSETRLLANFINKNIKIDGFRSAEKAITSPVGIQKIIDRIVESAPNWPPLISLLLNVWAEDKTDLRQAVDEVLAKYRRPLDDQAGSNQQERASLSMDELQQILSDTSIHDVKLMTVYLLGYMPTKHVEQSDMDRDNHTEESPVGISSTEHIELNDTDRDNHTEESPVGTSSTIWSDFLVTLSQIETNDDTWDDSLAEQFIEQVGILVRQKREHRNAGRNLLDHALTLLREEQEGQLAYFGMSEADVWDADACPKSEAYELADRVDQLRTLLAEQRSLRVRITEAANYSEEVSLTQQGQDLVKTFHALYNDLSAALAAHKSVEQLEQSEVKAVTGTSEPDREADLPDDYVTPDLLMVPAAHSSERVADMEIDTSIESAQVEAVAPIEPEISQAVSAVATEIPSLKTDAETEASKVISDPPAVILLPSDLPFAVSSLDVAQQIDVTNATVSETVTDIEPPVEMVTASLHVPAQSETASADVPAESIPSREDDIQLPIPDTKSGEPTSTVNLLTDIITHDDLPLAYWLARSLQERGEASPVPDWLLAAVYGARLLTFAHEGVGPLINDLQEIALLHEVGPDQAHQMLGLAASLRPTLLAPNAGLIDWVVPPSICPALQPLVAAVRRFADRKITMRAEDLTDVVDAEARERAINEIIADARIWLRDAPNYRTNYVPASNVWREMVGSQGEIRALIKIVSENRRSEIDTLSKQLDTWRSHDHLMQRIDAIDRTLRGINWGEIDRKSHALEQLKRYITDACTLAGRWQAIVSYTRSTANNGRWRFEHTQHLCVDVQHALPDVWDALNNLVKIAPPLIAAATVTLRMVIVQLCGTLKLTLPEGAEQYLISVPAISLNDGLRAGLTRRLWLLAEIAPDDNHEPDPSALCRMRDLIIDPQIRQRTVAQAIESWVSVEDYRFVEPLLSSLADQAIQDTLTRHVQEARHASTGMLRAHVEETRNKLDLAFADSIIDEYERTKTTNAIQAIDPANTEMYRREHAKLHELDHMLNQACNRRIAVLETEWHDLQYKLAEHNISDDDRKIIERKVAKALHRRDPRLIEEDLALVRRVLSGYSIDEYWRTHSTTPTLGERQIEFLRNRERLVATLKPGLSTVTGALRLGQAVEGIAQPISADGFKALDVWRQIKQTPGKLSVIHIKALLAFLGFENAEVSETAPSAPSLRRTWSIAEVSNARPNSRPIPQFGSLSPTQTIIVLWESPESLTTAIQRINVQVRQAILVYLGTLNTQQRRDISRIGRGKDKQSILTLAALDEPLLLALAQEPDVSLRFRLFLHYSLPATSLNPYMPNNRGNIPSEIFFGRNEMAESLQDPRGSCIIYGGRQLGKSALLYEAGRRFVRRPSHFATVEDIYTIGESPDQPPSTLWHRIRNIFRDKFKLTGQVKVDRPEDIIARIKRVFQENPACHVLMMLDEADTFLDADARDRFRVVLDLRRLMSDTGGRFKIVFAGLHNVQRFASLPNQPLAQFGTPICIGPMDPPDARALVTQPLAALGYHFRDETSVARILSYTNYHAGLLQIFCDKLLQHLLHGRGRSMDSQVYIDQVDIDQTYTRIKANIQDRFNLTLSLDLRYKAITLALIANQMGAPHVYGGTYRIGEIWQLINVWWPQGFRDVNNDETFRTLLDEMCGLGILVHTHEGTYRLRSPNLVRLLGTDRDINSELEQLQRVNPITDSDVATYHAPLDLPEVPKPYSPLNYAQERLLNQNRSGVVLVFASDAGDLPRLPVAFTRFLSDEARQEIRDLAVPLAVIRTRQVGQWLASQQQRYKDQERLFFTARLVSTDPIELATVVDETISWNQQNHMRRPFVRVAFVFEPKTTDVWLQIPREQRSDMESEVDAVISLQPWSEHAVQQRLLYENKIALADVCSHVMKASGGWALLLDEVFRRCGKEDDPRHAVETLEQELLQPESNVARQFQEALGLPSTIVQRLIEFLHRDVGGEATLDFIEPEYLGEPRLTRDDCDTALIYLQRMGYVRLMSNTVVLDPIVRRLMGQL